MLSWLSLATRTEQKSAPLNVWSLRKDRRIKSLLLIIIDRLGRSGWYVDQDIQMSDESIYLVHPDDMQLRAYLHVHGQQPDRAGLHLEYPQFSGTPPTYEVFDNITSAQLVDMLAAHFGLSHIAEPGSVLGG